MSLLDTAEGDSRAKRWIQAHLDYPYVDWCLLWPFSRNQGGYADFGVDRTLVHRVMCERQHGPAPTDRPFAAHNCGHGHLGCVNRHHVAWKTHAENMLDMHQHTPKVTRFKLTPAQVDEIRSLKDRARIRDIAEQFGVTDVTIRQIHSGKIWKGTSSIQVRVFSEDEVNLIRSTPLHVKTAKRFADEFGVHRSVIDRIRSGETYKYFSLSTERQKDQP